MRLYVSLWFIRFIIVSLISISVFAEVQCGDFYGHIFYPGQKIGPRIFEVNFARLNLHFENIRSLPDDQKISYLMESDARTIFFRLQSLARTYSLHFDSPRLERHRVFFNEFEDLLGQVDMYNTLVATATSLNETKLVDYFKEKELTATTDLLRKMRLEGLTSEPTSKLYGRLDDLAQFKKWKKPKGDLSILTKALVFEIELLSKSIKDRHYTNDNIELGLHELRRHLRSIAIQVQELNHLMAFSYDLKVPNKLARYYGMLSVADPKLGNAIYLKSAGPDIDEPVLIPFTAYSMLISLVSSIGKVKDKAEKEIDVSKAATELGYTPAQIAALEKKLYTMAGRTEAVDHKALAIAAQENIEASGLLDYFASQIRKLNSKYLKK